MNSLLADRRLELLTRLVVGTIFVSASIEKAAEPAAFAAMIDNYKVLSPALSMFVASTLPWVELICGVAVILGVGVRGGALVIGLLTIGFTFAVISGIMRGLDISCGCYTLDPEVGKIGWRKVVENSGIVVLSVFLVYSTAARVTLDRLVAGRREQEASSN
ncbi:MAG: DoxX family membrane protein [Bacteroidetes bacterium]|jgi:uncharacterized membrane protein YphA (DoxX/SURF4 family)|nr:DoxX family membrane protein [Bacteroidota bacterium]